MKVILISILVGIGTALVGWVISTFLAEILFSGLPLDAAIICGWAIYLCIVVIVCTGIILSKVKGN